MLEVLGIGTVIPEQDAMLRAWIISLRLAIPSKEDGVGTRDLPSKKRS